jgi:hypothetical protein
MIRRSAISTFALAGAFVLGMLMSNRPTAVLAQPANLPRGKCVGISAVHTMPFRVYRAFEDGTVEATNDGANGISTPWVQIGK